MHRFFVVLDPKRKSAPVSEVRRSTEGLLLCFGFVTFCDLGVAGAAEAKRALTASKSRS
jgi:hypothetical protein